MPWIFLAEFADATFRSFSSFLVAAPAHRDPPPRGGKARGICKWKPLRETTVEFSCSISVRIRFPGRIPLPSLTLSLLFRSFLFFKVSASQDTGVLRPLTFYSALSWFGFFGPPDVSYFLVCVSGSLLLCVVQISAVITYPSRLSCRCRFHSFPEFIIFSHFLSVSFLPQFCYIPFAAYRGVSRTLLTAPCFLRRLTSPTRARYDRPNKTIRPALGMSPTFLLCVTVDFPH